MREGNRDIRGTIKERERERESKKSKIVPVSLFVCLLSARLVVHSLVVLEFIAESNRNHKII